MTWMRRKPHPISLAYFGSVAPDIATGAEAWTTIESSPSCESPMCCDGRRGEQNFIPGLVNTVRPLTGGAPKGAKAYDMGAQPAPEGLQQESKKAH